LIRVENSLVQTFHRPVTEQKTGLKIRESNRLQTVTNQNTDSRKVTQAQKAILVSAPSVLFVSSKI
jgi:hypothetical protein